MGRSPHYRGAFFPLYSLATTVKNLNNNPLTSKFYQLVAALYAGGYRFLVIFLIDFIFSPAFSSDFARYFFWCGLIASVVGLPVAARSQVQKKPLSHLQQLTMAILLLIPMVIVSWFFWQDSAQSFGLVFFAGTLLVGFEIMRMERAALGQFGLLTLCSIASLFALLALTQVQTESAELVIILTFAGLAIPVFCSYFAVSYSVPATLTLTEAFKPVGANAATSLIATGLTFIVPLLLIEEFGREYSSTLAQVFAIASLSFSYPRYLAAGFIYAAKHNQATLATVKQLTRKIAIFVVLSCALFIACAWWFAPMVLQLLLLFVAMQFSQLTLPYANWWTSQGQEIRVMRLNFLSGAILAIASSAVFYFQATGPERGQSILILFTLYQLLRFYLYSKPIQPPTIATVLSHPKPSSHQEN